MKVLHFSDEQSWLNARIGKITGSRLNDIVVKRGTGHKIGYFELIAERLALSPDQENVLDRGHRLEEEAIERFEKETGKTVDKSLVMWQREDNENIAVSPDGFIGKTEAVEVKCLASARHIEALLTDEIPSEYELQIIQYFICNEKLKTLYFIFYDPRLQYQDFFYKTIKRADVQEDCDKYLQFQKDTLKEVEDVVLKLSF